MRAMVLLSRIRASATSVLRRIDSEKFRRERSIQVPAGLSRRVVQNFFWLLERMVKNASSASVAVSDLRFRRASERARRVISMCEKFRFHRDFFIIAPAIELRVRARSRGRRSRSLRADETAPRAPTRASRRTPFVKRSRCFFLCAVVIGIAMPAIRVGTVPTPPFIWLRRAAWLRKPNRRRSPRRRSRRRRPLSARRRSGSKLLRSFDFEACHRLNRRHRPGDRDAVAGDEAGSSRRQRASARLRFELPGSAIRPRDRIVSTDQQVRTCSAPDGHDDPADAFAARKSRRCPSFFWRVSTARLGFSASV